MKLGQNWSRNGQSLRCIVYTTQRSTWGPQPGLLTIYYIMNLFLAVHKYPPWHPVEEVTWPPGSRTSPAWPPPLYREDTASMRCQRRAGWGGWGCPPDQRRRMHPGLHVLLFNISILVWNVSINWELTIAIVVEVLDDDGVVVLCEHLAGHPVLQAGQLPHLEVGSAVHQGGGGQQYSHLHPPLPRYLSRLQGCLSLSGISNHTMCDPCQSIGSIFNLWLEHVTHLSVWEIESWTITPLYYCEANK